jgi:eukaryotic-like serine/threonine-protein kinase
VNDPAPSEGDAQRFQAALGEYLERVDRGESPDPEAFISSHPEVADELRMFLAAEKEFAALAPPANDAARGSPISLPISRAEWKVSDMAESGIYSLVDRLAEEFTHRYRRGERPSIKEYIDRYPEIADELRQLLPAMAEIERVKEEVDGRERTGPPSQPPLTQLGDYHILREIGYGGMGVVYEAEQVSLGRRVALKLLPEQRVRGGQHKRRFEREARAAAKLHHTNIVTVFGVGEHKGQPYYVMQLIRGLGLDQILDELRKLQFRDAGNGTPAADGSDTVRMAPSAHEMARSLMTGQFAAPSPDEATGHAIEGPPVDAKTVVPAGEPSEPARPAGSATSREAPIARPISSSSINLPGESESDSAAAGKRTYWQSVARIGIQVASALDYAHKQGIFHRDVKPSNLLLDKAGTVWVTDFGLAKMDDEQNLTHTGDILGTIRYMAPEAFDGKSDQRSDVYSLGVTLYELLTLQPTFHHQDHNQLMKQVTTEEPLSLSRLNPAIPADLRTIVHKAMGREPARRYATAEEMGADLQRFLNDEPILARPVGSLERLWRWCHRNPTIASLAAIVLLLITALALISTLGAIRLGRALKESEINLQASETANAEKNVQLWNSLIGQARASRMTHEPGQRQGALGAIKRAQDLPLPPGRSVDELRTEAIAALLLPDLETAKEWNGFPVGIGTAAFDANFERYARAGMDGKVSIRRVIDDAELCALPGGARVSPYGGLQFSPDGRFLFQGFESRAPLSRLWKLDGPQPVRVVDGGPVSDGCAFEPGGRRCALSYPNQTIRILDLETGRETKTLTHTLRGTCRPTWNPRQPRLALWSTSDVCQIIDVETGKLRELKCAGRLSWTDWHPDGEILAVCTDEDPKIYLIDTLSGQPILPPLTNRASGREASRGLVCRFNHSGDWLASTDWDRLVHIWDARTGQQLLTYERPGLLMQFSRDDDFLGPTTSGTKIGYLRCHRSKGLRTVTFGQGLDAIGNPPMTDPEGRWFAGSGSAGVSIADLVRGRELAVLPLSARPVRFNPADHSLWTCGVGGLLRWPIRPEPAKSDAARVGPPEKLATLTGCRTSQDGTLLVSGDSAGATLMNRLTGRSIPLGPQDDVRSADVSPDKRWVATGSFGLHVGGGVHVWDTGSGRHVAELPVPGLCDVQFSPDNRWLVTTSGGCRLWDVGTWHEGVPLGSNNGTCAFSADGRLLALGDQKGVVRLVHPETGGEIARLTISEPTRLRPRSFTRDGAQLVSIGIETLAVYVFDLRAIRGELQERDLDWDAPPLPPARPVAAQPSRLIVDLGNLKDQMPAVALVLKAAQLSLSRDYAGALAALRKAVQADPNDPNAYNALARFLITGPKELRDPAAALPLARWAIEFAPDPSPYRNTLGVALYRNGRFKEALGVLEKSLAAGKGKADGFDLFFLAMCERRLGDKAAAKVRYDQAVKWLQARRGKLSSEEVQALTAFQAEAEAELSKP